jgi:hypothetical protein
MFDFVILVLEKEEATKTHVGVNSPLVVPSPLTITRPHFGQEELKKNVGSDCHERSGKGGSWKGEK